MKTAIITGASRGIGLATAQIFAKRGYCVAINSLHDNENLKNACLSCNELSNGNCISFPGDVSDPKTADLLIKTAYEKYGSIDVLINNAGISFIGLIQDTSDETWQNIINTNLSSVHYLTRAAVPYMLRIKRGCIINISSVWGNTGASCETAYSASKGGVNAYTKACAKELAPSGISVNAIACGCVKTDMLSCYNDEEISELKNEIPAGRLATPEEIAEIVFLTSQMPSYLSGQIITADGCWT